MHTQIYSQVSNTNNSITENRGMWQLNMLLGALYPSALHTCEELATTAKLHRTTSCLIRYNGVCNPYQSWLIAGSEEACSDVTNVTTIVV